jgi:hypothetical protein
MWDYVLRTIVDTYLFFYLYSLSPSRVKHFSEETSPPRVCIFSPITMPHILILCIPVLRGENKQQHKNATLEKQWHSAIELRPSCQSIEICLRWNLSIEVRWLRLITMPEPSAARSWRPATFKELAWFIVLCWWKVARTETEGLKFIAMTRVLLLVALGEGAPVMVVGVPAKDPPELGAPKCHHVSRCALFLIICTSIDHSIDPWLYIHGLLWEIYKKESISGV